MAEFEFEIRDIFGGKDVITDYPSRSIEEAGIDIKDESLITDRVLAEAESHKKTQLTVFCRDNTEFESPLEEVGRFLASLDGTGDPIRARPCAKKFEIINGIVVRQTERALRVDPSVTVRYNFLRAMHSVIVRWQVKMMINFVTDHFRWPTM